MELRHEPLRLVRQYRHESELPDARGRLGERHLFFPFADYVHHLHFAFMGAAEARYDNFSLLNDLLYVSLGGSSKHAHLTSVAPVEGSPSIPAGLRTSMSVSLQAAVWTTAVGYTLASGPWGYFEPILGVRMLRIDATADYGLLAAVQGPNNIIVLPKSGSLRTARTEWDGVVGVRGRYEIAGTRFFIPYYFDVGTGDLPLTWQGFSGVGCHFAKADLSIGYRYLAYTNRAGAQVDNLSMGGLIAAATFRF